MARLFNGSSDFLQTSVGVAPLTGPPFTFAAWGSSTDLTAQQTVLSIGNSAGTAEEFNLGFRGDQPGDVIGAGARTGSFQSSALTSTGYASGKWHHLAGVFVSATERYAYLDGGGKGTSTTSRAPTGIDRARIGGAALFGAGNRLTGRAAFGGVWTAALADTEVALLSLGYHPRLVRWWDLAACWELEFGVDVEPDRVGGCDLAITGATPIDGPPGIIYPPGPDFAAMLFSEASGVPAVYYRLLQQHLGA